MTVLKSLAFEKLLVSRTPEQLTIEYDGETLCRASPGGKPSQLRGNDWGGYCEYFTPGGLFKIDLRAPDGSCVFLEYDSGDLNPVSRFEEVKDRAA